MTTKNEVPTQFENMTDVEGRALLEAEHSPILDAWRAKVPSLETSQLLSFFTQQDRLIDLFESEEGDLFDDAANAAAERRLAAAVVALADEIDRRIPVPR